MTLMCTHLGIKWTKMLFFMVQVGWIVPERSSIEAPAQEKIVTSSLRDIDFSLPKHQHSPI